GLTPASRIHDCAYILAATIDCDIGKARWNVPLPNPSVGIVSSCTSNEASRSQAGAPTIRRSSGSGNAFQLDREAPRNSPAVLPARAWRSGMSKPLPITGTPVPSSVADVQATQWILLANRKLVTACQLPGPK